MHHEHPHLNANCELNNSLPNGSILHLSSQRLPPPPLDFTRRRTDTQCSCITTIAPPQRQPIPTSPDNAHAFVHTCSLEFPITKPFTHRTCLSLSAALCIYPIFITPNTQQHFRTLGEQSSVLSTTLPRLPGPYINHFCL